jgi:Uma2 family endonuclease
MRAIMLEVPPELLEERRRLGLDRWDEVWEGVLHMTPPPAEEHGNLHSCLDGVIGQLVRKAKRGRLMVGPGVRRPGTALEDYRVPDLAFVAAERVSIISGGWIEGPPDVVVEVRSPGDETYEKMAWYARLGVRELLVVDRDTVRLELYRLAGESYVAVARDESGRLPVEGLAMRIWIEVRGRERYLIARDEKSGETLETPIP